MRLLALFVFFITLQSCGNKDIGPSTSIDNPYYDKAYESVDQGKADSSFLYFSQAKDVFVAANDSLNAANCFINMAIIQKDKGDFYGAQETALQAMDYLDEDKPEHRPYLSANYNNIAVATDYLKDYDRAISYYESAIKYSDDSIQTNIYRNNLAINYTNVKQYQEALKLYEQILSEIHDNPREYARVLSNRARALWLSNPSYPISGDFLHALKIREQEGDLWGQNASLAHLVDYYIDQNIDSALYYARKRYAMALKINSPTDQISALYKLIPLSPMDSVKRYFEVYRVLKDSVQLAREAAKNQFAVIRYEVEKNKTNNLILKNENIEKQSRLTRQRIFTGASILLLVVVSMGGTLYHKKRKQGLELEAQNKIKASKLKTSRKVHDVVANGIYRVMAEIEYKEDVDLEMILDKLEDMYHKSRDISYEAEDQEPEDRTLQYHESVTELIRSFANEMRRVLIVGNESAVWEPLTDAGRDDVLHILQELMVNMDKHSQAENIVLRFENNSDYLSIVYSDDGVGQQKGAPHSNGLTSIISRIDHLGGTIHFADDKITGYKVEITIPFL